VTKNLVFYNDPPTNCDWAIEYIVLEFFSASLDRSDFKCVVCTTYSEELAEKVVKENEYKRTLVKAWRLFPK
jgi:hypothetical protein